MHWIAARNVSSSRSVENGLVIINAWAARRGAAVSGRM
jgi:hypothetical protein